ncbi:MAG TPA: hypothetical protein VK718_02995 [Ferruginibacter sp.]|nr:hypothetical protein [Ferruginibacter sp.]
MLTVLLLLVFLYITLHLTPVQNWIAKRATTTLSEKLHTEVSIQNVDVRFFDKLVFEGLLIKDLHKDTLLYAGAATVNITDWFFLKDKPVLKYVSLSDAVVNMNRTDSVWNYQFLVDYLSSPKKDTTTKGGLALDIKKLQLKNVFINSIDQWKGQDMLSSVKELDLSADDIDLVAKKINLNAITVDGGSFAIKEYTGYRPDADIPIDIIDTTQAYKWNNDGWIVNVKNIHLENSVFTSDNQTDRQPYTDHFDGLHLRFGSIAGDIANIHFEKDTLTSDVQLSSTERSGFEVKKLQAKMKFTPELMEFRQLDLVTNKSRLGNYYAMKYNNFTDDMNSFLHKVTLYGNFENCQVSSDDLAFFAPELKNWKRVFSVKGTAKGTIDNLSANKIMIQSGNTIIDGDISLSGLPDIDKTFIDFKSRNLQTNYADITTIVPSLKKVTYPQLSKLGYIHYKGTYTGFINDFVAYGTINTNLGTVTADINMKLPQGRPVSYVGKISTTGFQLGQFLNVTDVGSIAFSGNVKGQGLNTQDLKANFNGNISSITYMDYPYQNIKLNGDFEKRLFDGTVSINDPNLQLDYLKGTIDLNKDEPKFNFDANLTKANLKELKLTQNDFLLTGYFNFDFSGSNIDNFLGSAKIYNATLLHEHKPLSFDSLKLQSQIINGDKFLTLQSNEMEASVVGKFTILELPDAFKLFLNHYYPSYIKKPSYAINDQNFKFMIKTKNVDNYVQLIDPKLQGFDNTVVTGDLRLKENELNINADVPEFGYEGKTFNNIKLVGHGNLDTLVAKVDASDIAINDSLHLPNSDLVFSSHNDISSVSLTTSATQTLNNASLNATLQTMANGVKIDFLPSSFVINDKKWQIEKDGELTVGPSQLIASNINLSQGNQQVTISTTPSPTLPNTNDILIGLKKVSIIDIAPYVFKEPRLEGLLTGNIKISDPFGKAIIDYDAQAEQVRVDADSIGIVQSKGNYNTQTGIAKFTATADNEKYQFDVDGSFNSHDSTANQTLISLKTNKFDLAILNNYLGDIFSNISGTANTSDLKITGSTDHLLLTGSAFVNAGSLLVNYTQCKYKFSNATIKFNADEIDLGTIQLKDTLNNTATISGKIYHTFFNDFGFDNIHFQTKKLLLLNTTKKDNTQFYGKIIGKGLMTLNGPVSNMIMDIDGEPSNSELDSNHIYLLTGNSAENNGIDYIDFVQFGSKMKNVLKTRLSTNLLVDMNVSANAACKIDVILDEVTGDIIKGQGVGKLNIRVGSSEPLSVRGRYDITNGEYTFNFQTIMKYKFTVNSGSIVWTGDPYLANIDIAAQYLATKVDLTSLPLVGSNVSARSDVIVYAYLTETLLKPKINFEFKLPDYSSFNNDFSVLNSFALFARDENEMNKQVTSILLFNAFMSNNSFLNAGGGYSVLANTIGGVVSGALSSSFNKLLQKVLNGNTVSSYVEMNSTLALDNQVQGTGKVGITKTFHDNRIIVSVGGSLDYNNPNAAPATTNGRPNNLLLTPDVTIQWILTKDGRIRVVGFNQTDYDLLIGERNRTGVKLTYRKDEDKLLGIFKSKGKRKKLDDKDSFTE